MLTELFNFFGKSKAPKDVAKDRLKLVLVHDRAGVSPQFLDMVKVKLSK